MPQSENLRGALFMSLSMMGYTLNDALLKLISDELPLMQIIFLRGVLVTTAALILVRLNGHASYRPTRRDGRLILARSVFELAGAISFLTAVFNMPIANANAILQSLPFVVTLGAALAFGERVSTRQYVAIVIGFLGVLIIVRPGSEGFTVFSLSAMVGVLCITARDLCTRRLSPDAPGMAVVAVTAVLVTLGAGAASLVVGWEPIRPLHAVFLMGSASFLIVGLLYSVSAMRVGEIGFVQPFRYTLMLWAILAGYVLFDETPDVAMMIGMLIVVATGLYMLRDERQARQ